MAVYDKNKPLILGSQRVPNHRYRQITLWGQSAPTQPGAMVGGWAGQHMPQIPIGSDQAFQIIGINTINHSQTGEGTRQIIVYGLDKDLNMQEETVFTNGTTSVPLTKRYNHINEWRPTVSGGNPSIAGTIDIRRSDNTSITYGRFTPNQQANGWYKCPAGYRALLTGLYLNRTATSGTSTILVTVWRNNGSNTYETLANFQQIVNININLLAVLNPGDSIYCYQTSNVDVKSNFTIVLVPA
jgi:hypothetical protein